MKYALLALKDFALDILAEIVNTILSWLPKKRKIIDELKDSEELRSMYDAPMWEREEINRVFREESKI